MPSPSEEKKAAVPHTVYPRPKSRRVSISVERAVGEEFSNQAGRSGSSLYDFANQWLAAASMISTHGGTAGNTEEQWKVWSVFKDVEVIPLPADFVEQVVEGLCKTDEENALKTFRALGASLSSLLKIYAPNIDQLVDLAKGFAVMAPLKRFDIERIDGGAMVISIVGAGRKYEVTECAFEVLKALLAGYGYTVIAYELGAGTIRLEAEPQGKALEPEAMAVPA
jgi:hypothetical protein